MEERPLISVVQLCSSEDKKDNLRIVENMVQEASESGAKMVFLPEATDFISTSDKILALAEPINGDFVGQLKSLAEQYNVWISAGVHEKVIGECNKTKIYNSHLMINNKGDILANYRKLHLFDCHPLTSNQKMSFRESSTITAGSQLVGPLLTPIGRIGLCTCYDLRFPEMSTMLCKLGATVLLYPSAFTTVTGRDHWQTLLRARAIENQAFVIAAAQCGTHHKKRSSYGRSMIIDPWGRILSEGPTIDAGSTEPCLISSNLPLEELNDVRERMPVSEHRRQDIFKLEVPDTKVNYTSGSFHLFSDKAIPSDTVFIRSKYSFGFTNIRCVVPGHVLIASYRVAPKITDLNPEEIADLFQTAVTVQRVLEIIHNVQSSTLVVQDGQDAGQTVRHVHCHILPRRQGDFDRNDDVYTSLANHDTDDMAPIRQLTEMIDEAKIIEKEISKQRNQNS